MYVSNQIESVLPNVFACEAVVPYLRLLDTHTHIALDVRVISGFRLFCHGEADDRLSVAHLKSTHAAGLRIGPHGGDWSVWESFGSESRTFLALNSQFQLDKLPVKPSSIIYEYSFFVAALIVNP